MHKPRLRKSVLLLVLFTATLLLLSSCSAIFKANLGGKVRDDESNAGIADMAIYAYTNVGQRDSDYAAWQQLGKGTFTPDNDAGYVARTNSDADGAFVINTIVWESLFPAFGKTADYKEISLLFYHEDYGLHKNNNPVWITSDSTNVSMVDERFSKINQTTNIQIYLRNVANETLIEENFDVQLAVKQDENDPAAEKVERATIRRTGVIPVTYPIDLKDPAVKATATLEGSNWMQCKKDGTVIEATDAPPSFAVSGNNSEITLYLKKHPYDYPLISGEIYSDERKDATIVFPDSSLTVWLGERKEGKISLFDKVGAEAITRSEGTGANNSVIRHGIFSNLGANMSWEDPVGYTSGTYGEKEVLLVVDMDRDRELSVGDCYYTFAIRSDQDLKELGTLRWDDNKHELQEVVANDLP